MFALYRNGRQAEALRSFQEGRQRLIDELGVEPGPELRDLERRMLEQAPDLSRSPPRPAQRPALLGELSTVLGTSMIAPLATLIVGEQRITLTSAVTTVGRQPDRTIVLDDTKASRVHAEIRRSTDGYWLIDSGSTNGTKLNTVPVTTVVALSSGDEIVIGSTTLRYVAG